MSEPVKKKIRVESDGETLNTRVLDTETGKPIGYVQTLDIHFEAGKSYGSAKLDVLLPEISAVIPESFLSISHKIWCVGEHSDVGNWRLLGSFITKSEAEEVCRFPNRFIIPVTFNGMNSCGLEMDRQYVTKEGNE